MKRAKGVAVLLFGMLTACVLFMLCYVIGNSGPIKKVDPKTKSKNSQKSSGEGDIIIKRFWSKAKRPPVSENTEEIASYLRENKYLPLNWGEIHRPPLDSHKYDIGIPVSQLCQDADEVHGFSLSIAANKMAFALYDDDEESVAVKMSSLSGKDSITVCEKNVPGFNLSRNSRGYSLAFSKDGKYLAFALPDYNDHSKSSIMLYDVDKKKLRVLVEHAYHFAIIHYRKEKHGGGSYAVTNSTPCIVWSEAANELYYADHDKVIKKIDVETGKIEPITEGIIPFAIKGNQLFYVYDMTEECAVVKLLNLDNNILIKEISFQDMMAAHFHFVATPDFRYLMIYDPKHMINYMPGIPHITLALPFYVAEKNRKRLLDMGVPMCAYDLQGGRTLPLNAGCRMIYQVDGDFLKYLGNKELLKYYGVEE